MQFSQKIIIFFFVVMLIQMAGFGIYLKRKNCSIGGKPPIDKTLFKFGKSAMGITWLSLFVQACGWIDLTIIQRTEILTFASVFVFITGFIFQFIAYFELDKNLKFGIPKQKEDYATLKMSRIYRISRNPMYFGFNLMTLSSCCYVLNPIIWISAIFTFFVHHQIILKEEDYLNKRFSEKWRVYSDKTRRYL